MRRSWSEEESPDGLAATSVVLSTLGVSVLGAAFRATGVDGKGTVADAPRRTSGGMLLLLSRSSA